MKNFTTRMNKLPSLLLVLICLLVLSFAVNAQTGVNPTCISLTAMTPGFTENFNTLVNTGTSSTVPAGFGFSETLANMNTTYAAGTGSGTGGDTYSFGATANAERAFGGLQSGTLNPTIGGCVINNTGATVNEIMITYDGEQWRLGTLGRTDQLDFEYSLNATSLSTGTWTAVNALDFVAPVTTGTVGALDGNLAANRTAGITSTITGLTIANGSTFYFRYLDFNATGADDGLGIDNFSLTASTALAASATVAGRVTDANGNGISRVYVKVSGGELSEPISLITNPFGYFNFEVPSGQTYFVTVGSKSHTFANPTQVITVNDNVSNLNFTAEER